MRPALVGAHGRSRLAALELVGTPMESEALRTGPGIRRRGSAQRQELEGRILTEWDRGGGHQAERAPCPLTPHLSVAQHWMSSLHGRHSQRETFQPPQQAAEVIIVTHCSCQGLLTCTGILGGRRQAGGQGPTESRHLLGFCPSSGCSCRASTPSSGHSRKCSLAEIRVLDQQPTSATQAALQSPALTTALNQGTYLFQALNQCIQEAPHIVDTGIWEASMAEKGALGAQS